MLSQSLSTKVPIQMFDILDYLQVEIKKNVNTLKESMMKILNEINLLKIMKIQLMMIWVMLNQQQMMQQQWKFIRTHKKIFLGCKFCFY